MSEPEVEAFESETVEQIEARFRAGEGIVDDAPSAPPPVVETPPAEAPPAEATPAATPPNGDPTASPPAEAKADDPPAEPEFDERQFAIDEMRLKLEKAEADNRRVELARSRETGEIGHLRKQLAQLQAALTQPRPTDQDDYVEPRGRRVSEPSLPGQSVDQSRLAELENDARAGAIAAEYQDFLTTRAIKPEESQVLLTKLAPAIQEQWEPYKEMAGEMSARSVRKVLRTLLDSAYADLRLREMQEAANVARARKVSQVPEVRKAKLAASVAGSGGASPPAPREKSPEDKSAEEADAELTRLYGRRRGR